MPHYRCGPKGLFDIDFPEGLFAMGGRGWRGDWGPFHFDFSDGPGGWGDHGGRRRRGSKLGADDLRLLILFLIAEKPRHGYDIIKAVETMSDGRYAPSPGVVYPTLTMLQDLGHIEEVPEEGSRKTYQATAEGRTWLEEEGLRMTDVLERLDAMGGGQRRSADSPQLGRAVKNLMTALSQRIGRDGLDDELLHEIAPILDEAAQRIERVR